MLALTSRHSEQQIIAMLRALHAAGDDVNAVAEIMYIRRDHGGSALHIATQRGLKKAMAELASYGENVNLKDEDGLTALDYAMARGWLTYLTVRPAPRMDLVKVLRDLGATVGLAQNSELAGRVSAHRSSAPSRIGHLAAVSTTRRRFLGAGLRALGAATLGVTARSVLGSDKEQVSATELAPGVTLLVERAAMRLQCTARRAHCWWMAATPHTPKLSCERSRTPRPISASTR